MNAIRRVGSRKYEGDGDLCEGAAHFREHRFGHVRVGGPRLDELCTTDSSSPALVGGCGITREILLVRGVDEALSLCRGTASNVRALVGDGTSRCIIFFHLASRGLRGCSWRHLRT